MYRNTMHRLVPKPIFLATSLTVFSAAPIPLSFSAPFLKDLKVVGPKGSCSTVERSIAWVQPIKLSEDKPLQLVMGASDKTQIVMTPFRLGAEKDPCGTPTEARRIDLDVTAKGRYIKGVETVKGNLLLFDGRELSKSELSGFEKEQVKTIREETIPWDLLKPARDRGGEPTTLETDRLRQNFKNAFLAVKGAKVAGVRRVDGSFSIFDRHETLLGTRISGFPLISMSCDADKPTRCLIRRACSVQGRERLQPETTVGFSVSSKRKWLLYADSARHSIAVFKYSSCYGSTFVGTLKLPDRLKRLSSIYVDDTDRLWVATEQPDDFDNASVYFWNEDQW